MFWDDILLVTEQIQKYGLRGQFVDIGGMAQPCIADYDLTIATGDQAACYVALTQRPFDHVDPGYLIINPDKGDPMMEDLPYTFQDRVQTAACLNVIEHVENPFRAFAALYQIMQADSLLIVETVFAYPYHPSPGDYWRFTPDCLLNLAKGSGFTVLECDWRLRIPASKGIIYPGTSEPHEIVSVYCTLTKGSFTPRPGSSFTLPLRVSRNAQANSIIGGQHNERR